MGLFSFSKVMFLPDCEFRKEALDDKEKYLNIFKKLKIKCNIAGDNLFCGCVEYKKGEKHNLRKIIKKNLAFIKEKNIKKIITDSPFCLYILREVYPKYSGDFDIQAEHVSQSIHSKLIRLKGLNLSSEEAFYQDSCALSRRCNIYDEPREALRVLGLNLKEFKKCKENSICCGGEGRVYFDYPKISIAAALLKKEEVGENKIICSSKVCELNFKRAGFNVLNFPEFVLKKLNEAGI